MASPQHNERIVREFYQLAFVEQRAAEAAEKYFGDRYIQHNPFVADGAEGFVTFFTEVMPPSPDREQKILRTVAGDDMVVVHATITRASDERGTVLMDWFRLEDGKIVEHWDVYMPVPDPATVPHGNGVL